MLHNANPERFGGIQFPRLSAGAESQSPFCEAMWNAVP